MFSFCLAKKPKSVLDKVKEEMESIRCEGLLIDKHTKLFYFYYYECWRGDHQREVIIKRMFNNNTPISSIEQLFWQLEGMGNYEGGALGQENGSNVQEVESILSDEYSSNLY